MLRRKFAALWLLILFTGVRSFEVPCTEKLVGGSCNFDEECYGVNTVCMNKRCSCPTNFEEYQTDDSPPRRFCRPAPDKLNAPCQTDCKPPFTCRDGKCDCWGSGSEYNDGQCFIKCPTGTERYGSECRKVSHLLQPCSTDRDCVDAFNECRAGLCHCATGTHLHGMHCKPTCPDGTYPGQSCRRLFTNDVDMMEHKANGDTCAPNYYCATYGKPGIGDCCRMYCPYGDPDLSRTCDAGASASTKCRQLTHFCHTIKGPGYSKSMCCPRPCREPTPLFLDGKCMTLAHLDDLCQIDEQCEGGVSMLCDPATSRCRCRAGFSGRTLDRFRTCTASCPVGERPVGGECVKSSDVGGSCLSDAQCPRCSRCYNGQCQCRCGYSLKTGIAGSGCVSDSGSSNGANPAFNLANFFKPGALGGLTDFLNGGTLNSAATQRSCDDKFLFI